MGSMTMESDGDLGFKAGGVSFDLTPGS